MENKLERSDYKVLLAEDDIISARAIEKSLKEWGYEVISVRDGEKAWEVIETENIRLAILDWMMPKVEGIELCKKIRHRFQENESLYTYIILITGKGHQEDVVKGLSAGADDYITKPFHFLELKVRLQNGERIIKLEENRIQQANTDGLTKLWNKKKILEFMGEELGRSQRHEQPLGVLMIDIDFFKIVNDTYGHVAGDHILEIIAQRLEGSLRCYDKIGRYGGDEFLVVLPNCRQSDIEEIAERLRTSVCNETVQFKDQEIPVTVSLGGVSTESFPKISGVDLLMNSDKALYQAKEGGKNISKFLQTLNE
ncbi:diguanylate cyclase [Acidobacteriota bacterium]